MREVIAFPKLRDGSCPLTGAPAPVDREQLDALGISGGKAQGTRPEYIQKEKKAKIDMQHIARLAKLELREDEKEQLTRQLEAMAAFAGELEALSAEGIEPAEQMVPLKNVFRPDTVKPPMQREKLLEAAPETLEGYLLVPQLLHDGTEDTAGRQGREKR